MLWWKNVFSVCVSGIRGVCDVCCMFIWYWEMWWYISDVWLCICGALWCVLFVVYVCGVGVWIAWDVWVYVMHVV